MARKPDLPCARCGELMWRGKGVLPEGRATCQTCRRKVAKPRPKPITEWDCAGCGKRCEREPARGQRPKWCEECRARGVRREAICEQCDAVFWGWRKARFCSSACASSARRKPQMPKPAPIDQRRPLRRGYEDGDADLFFAELEAQADTLGDCWVWPRLNRSGYPSARFGKKEVSLHRIVLEVKHGAPLGSQHAHHICANAACVNPEHLQPVTHRDNSAEMLARQSYLARIRDLEVALAGLDPNHPLLSVVAVA